MVILHKSFPINLCLSVCPPYSLPCISVPPFLHAFHSYTFTFYSEGPVSSSSTKFSLLVFPLAEAEALSVGVDPSAQGLLEGMGLDGDALAPMETDEPTATDPKAKSKLTPAMATRIKQIKPLLSG